jgi:hypothetical protein
MLNTISNLGFAWTNTAALFFVGQTTVTRCVPRACASAAASISEVVSATFGDGVGDTVKTGAQSVVDSLGDLSAALPQWVPAPSFLRVDGGSEGCGCDDTVIVDGYVIGAVASVGLGAVWFLAMRGRITALQALPPEAWKSSLQA